jgi:hypothetical protein
MMYQGIMRRKGKLLFLGALGTTKKCCCECCVYEGDCIKRSDIPDGECDPVPPFDEFRGTINVEWCGLSFTFRPEDRPGQDNFGIGISGVPTGYEQACGTANWFGTDYDATYKNETKSLFILGGGYNLAPFWQPGDFPYASAPCIRIFFPIQTVLKGQLWIQPPGDREIFFDWAGTDSEYFVFIQDHCRRNHSVRVPGGGNSCNNDPNHLHCRTDPVVTINEAE